MKAERGLEGARVAQLAGAPYLHSTSGANNGKSRHQISMIPPGPVIRFQTLPDCTML